MNKTEFNEIWSTESESTNSNIKGKNLVLVIYDVPDNKRRLQYVKLLESYGYRVQKSAFEMLLDKKSIHNLKCKLGLIAKSNDLVKMYILKGISETHSWGNISNIEEEEVIFI